MFGGKTDINTYLYFAKYLGSGEKKDAYKPLTLFGFSWMWQFLSRDIFNNATFVISCKVGILALNVINFFVRHNALWVCLQNLGSTFSGKIASKLEHKDIKMMVECIMVGFLIGIVLMPGGHV